MGLQHGRRVGQVKFYPCKEGGGACGKRFSHVETGEDTRSFEV